MHITKRGEYALRSLIALATAESLGRSLIKMGELIERERLPPKFAEQIFAQLREAGYLTSKRGRNGGIALGKPADQIRLGEIIRMVDGPLAPIACTSQTAYQRCTCPYEAHCGLRMLMLDVRNAIARILDFYRLSDVVKLALQRREQSHTPSPWAETGLGQVNPREELVLAGLPIQLEEALPFSDILLRREAAPLEKNPAIDNTRPRGPWKVRKIASPKCRPARG